MCGYVERIILLCIVLLVVGGLTIVPAFAEDCDLKESDEWRLTYKKLSVAYCSQKWDDALENGHKLRSMCEQNPLLNLIIAHIYQNKGDEANYQHYLEKTENYAKTSKWPIEMDRLNHIFHDRFEPGPTIYNYDDGISHLDEPVLLSCQIATIKEDEEVTNLVNEVIKIEKPDFNGHVLKEEKHHHPSRLRLKRRRPRVGVWDKEWLSANDLELPIFYGTSKHWYFENNAHQRLDVDSHYKYFQGVPLVKVLDARDAYVYLYGTNYLTTLRMAVVDKQDPQNIKALDLVPFENRKSDSFLDEWQYIVWAIVEDDILYIQHTGNGYSVEFDGKTAYISAISLKDNRVLWTSSPLTANARNFELVGNSIYCGYGFPTEKHTLFVLDKFTGRRVQSIPLEFYPTLLVVKGEALYLLTEHTQEVYDILK